MKRIVFVLLIAIVSLLLVACGNKDTQPISSSDFVQENSNETESQEVVAVPKEEQIGTAGSNIPLKDNYTEAEKQIKTAFRNWITEAYSGEVVDSRINVEKIYTAEDEQENEALQSYNLGLDEIAFEVKYELKPAEGTDVMALTAATGEYDEESGWVTEKYNLGILRPNPSGDAKYIVTNVGTGW